MLIELAQTIEMAVGLFNEQELLFKRHFVIDVDSRRLLGILIIISQYYSLRVLFNLKCMCGLLRPFSG